MSKSSWKKLLVASVILSQAPGVVLAGSYRSSINGIDLGGVYQPPADVAKVLCKSTNIAEVTINDTNYDGSKPKIYDPYLLDMCNEGEFAARYMAERYAKGEGEFLGCADGLQQGLWNGYISAKDPSAAMLAEAKRKYTNTDMVNARSRAAAQATSEGRNVADGEIIRRFRSVVGTGAMPNNQYDYPSHSFTGYTNGYSADQMGGSFQDVYDNRWVSRNDSINERIAARAVHSISAQQQFSVDKLCNAVTHAWSDYSVISLWSYWKARGSYNFSKYGWNNVDRTWNFWKNRVSDSLDRLHMENIKPQTYTYYVKKKETYVKEPARRAKDPATGQDILDSQGNPVIIPAVMGTRIRNIEKQVTFSKSDYQKMYRDTFKTAYDKYYRNAYFGRAFVLEHKKAQGFGVLAGTAIGKIVARDTADKIAYDEKYRLDSVAAYNLTWEGNYDRQWADIWNRFANNAMVEVRDFSVEGELKDNIFKAGEKINAHVEMTNIGLGQGNVNISMYGDVTSAGKKVVTAPSSKHFSASTGFVNVLDSSLTPRERARVGVKISSAGSINFDSSLSDTKDGYIVINEVAEFASSPKVSFNPIAGTGQIIVDIKNPSSMETSAMVKIVADLGQFGTVETETLKLKAGETRSVTISFEGIDPLDLIVAGKIAAKLETKMNGRTLDKAHGSASMSYADRLSTFASYYNALLTGQTTNAGNQTVNSRIQKMNADIIRRTKSDIGSNGSGTNWKRPGSVNGTIVGQLGIVFTSSVAAGTMTEDAKLRYDQLGLTLQDLAPTVSGWGQSKAYRIALKKFAGSVDDKKKKDK